MLSASSILRDIVIYKDIKGSGVSGGSSSAASGWQTRDLNTISFSRQNNAWSSLASNEITLQPGTYFIYAVSTYFGCGNVGIRLFNVTDGTTGSQNISSTINVGNANNGADSSYLNTIVTISSPKTYRLEANCSSDNADGFGRANSFGLSNVYSMVKIEKWK